jgi:mono/diheme cytochrome c family protein
MSYIKLAAAVGFVAAISVFHACSSAKTKQYVITDNKTYEASLFRQNCAICHGAEAEGKTLDNGTKVPSLREGEFKKKSEAEIYDQIANGGNGMTPFRNQLTERELKMMEGFVYHNLRNQ